MKLKAGSGIKAVIVQGLAGTGKTRAVNLIAPLFGGHQVYNANDLVTDTDVDEASEGADLLVIDNANADYIEGILYKRDGIPLVLITSDPEASRFSDRPDILMLVMDGSELAYLNEVQR